MEAKTRKFKVNDKAREGAPVYKTVIFLTIFCLSLVLAENILAIDLPDCKPGYGRTPKSNNDCVQKNCETIKGAHYGYDQSCVCGSAGSKYENPADPNEACRRSINYKDCPGCIFACIHKNEKCPVTKETEENKKASPITPESKNSNASSLKVKPILTTKPRIKRTCTQYCSTLREGGLYDEVLEASGDYPLCKCMVDIRGNNNILVKTVTQNGDKAVTHKFNPTTGALIGKTIISREAERKRIRKLIGYKYSQEETDALLDDKRINKWFQYMMRDIKTQTNMLHLQFWWQHMVAILDHGFSGNSDEFVDTYNFGRCGDSMQWLEKNLAKDLKLVTADKKQGNKNDRRPEAMLSITGEKYNNMLNHVGLMIRPKGISNIAWLGIVKELSKKTREDRLTKDTIKDIDPRLLDAKVLDPYYKKVTTVREFIKGWPVLKIS